MTSSCQWGKRMITGRDPSPRRGPFTTTHPPIRATNLPKSDPLQRSNKSHRSRSQFTRSLNPLRRDHTFMTLKKVRATHDPNATYPILIASTPPILYRASRISNVRLSPTTNGDYLYTPSDSSRCAMCLIWEKGPDFPGTDSVYPRR